MTERLSPLRLNVKFTFKEEPKKNGNMTSGELKKVIEKNPEIILKIARLLRDFKDADPIEFREWMEELKVDQELKDKAGEEIKKVIVHNLDDLIAKALGIVVKYNTPPKIFRYDDTLYKEIYVDPNRCEIRRRTAKESLEDIKNILIDSGWNRVPKQVIFSVVNGVYGIPKLKGITSKPIVREDGTICAKPGFDNESKWYYQPGQGDDEGPVEGFLCAWLEEFGDNGVYVREIVDWIDSKPEMQIPKVISKAMEKSNPVIALGRALKEMQKVEHNGFQVVMTKDKHTKANTYKVKKIT